MYFVQDYRVRTLDTQTALSMLHTYHLVSQLKYHFKMVLIVQIIESLQLTNYPLISLMVIVVEQMMLRTIQSRNLLLSTVIVVALNLGMWFLG